MKIIKNKHIGAYGIIIDDNKIVLIKKARGGYTGKLDLPGGGIEHTELPEEALKRELLEEAGVTVLEYQLFDVTSTNIIWKIEDNLMEDLHHFGMLYVVKVKGRLKKEPDGIDSNGADWYLISDLKKENLTPFAVYALEKMGYQLK